MIKNTKSVIAALLVLAVILSFGVCSFADEYVPANEINEDELNELISYYLQDKQGDISVGYYYSQSDESWYYNADIFMYSASLYKVPNCMLLEEKENAGEITQTTDMYGYTVAQQEYAAIVNSDNDRGHDIVRFNGGEEYGDKCSDQFIKYTNLEEDYFTEPKFTGDSYYTARYYTQILAYLLNHSSEYTHVIDLMKQTQTGHYLHLMKDYDYEIAQKYGDYPSKEDGAVYHAAGIIYTPHPIVVTVMTRNAGYDEQLFGDIANILVKYSLSVDEKIDKEREEYVPVPTEEPVEATPQPTPEPEPVSTPVPTSTPEPEVITKKVSIVPIAVAGVVALAIGAILVSKFKPKKPPKQKYTPKH